MRRRVGVEAATWVLEHVLARPHGALLAGDLLEELHGGRSAGWYWREVLLAVGVRLANSCRAYRVPLAFSAGWSALYPVWQETVWGSELTRGMFARWSGLGWPYSAAVEQGKGILPAATFIWFGLLVYLLLRAGRADVRSGARIVAGLSLSLNVWLLLMIGSLGPLWSRGDGAAAPMERSFDLSAYHLVLSASLAVSLLSAIAVAGPPRRGRRASRSM